MSKRFLVLGHNQVGEQQSDGDGSELLFKEFSATRLNQCHTKLTELVDAVTNASEEEHTKAIDAIELVVDELVNYCADLRVARNRILGSREMLRGRPEEVE